MEPDYVLRKLVAALQQLSDDELRRLVKLLDQPNTRTALQSLVEGMLALRMAEARLVNHVGPSSKTQKKGRIIDGGKMRATDRPPEMREVVSRLLNDRKLFATTRDVVTAANEFLGCHLAYSKFRKGGRVPVIRRAISTLEGVASKERQRRIQKLVRSFDEDHGTEDYRELFRVLARNE